AGSVTQSSALITWTTNEASSTQVEYGLSAPAYGSFAPAAPDTTLVTAHSQALTGLTPGTLYHYRVLSRDAAGNLATSVDFTFTTVAPDTTPPKITAVQAGSITQTSATITWTTDEGSSTQVEYGLTAPAYGSFAPATPNTTPGTAHSQALSGLTPGTLYHYRVLSRDAAGNLATSADFTFTTASDTTPPAISAVQATGITQTSATVTWTTNEGSTTQVEYGTTLSYGSLAPATANPALVTSHSQGLAGLTAGTLYHYRVHSVDGVGNAAVSGDFTFTTQAVGSGAWQFDGSNDRAMASDANSLDVTGPLTLEGWFKFDSIQGNKWHTLIFKQGLSNNLAYALYHHNGIWFEIKSGSTYIVLEDFEPLQTGVWYHIAGTYDRQNMRIFVNGQQTASRAFTGAVSTSTFALTLGYNNVWSSEQFSGTIDEVRISNVARYSGPFTPAGAFSPDANTVALWHFDEGSGQTTADASGNGNTLRRGATTSAENTDPAWVAGAPLVLLSLAGLRRRR
ncbi:MAG: fibronectin type III domain-containing protein, partial [Gemmatimonadales bacterium]